VLLVSLVALISVYSVADLTPDKAPARIAGMFDAIAPRYDLLNHLLSAGIDRRWRRQAIASLQLTGRETLIDVCTGTADVALEARDARRILGVDFAAEMLRLGLDKVRAAHQARRIGLVRGDATAIPAPDACADCATVAFGIRNVEHRGRACVELARVLRPGGRLAILEFGVPRIPGISAIYLWYFKHVLPRIGRLISGHMGAYSYLPASVSTFPPAAEFVTLLQQSGFRAVRAVPLTFGIVYLYAGIRDAESGISRNKDVKEPGRKDPMSEISA
jgi:demethylmenaquinone methyltransferase / 2-methoxy-6-polyprenyl-1,4-benzoquinol methylase